MIIMVLTIAGLLDRSIEIDGVISYRDRSWEQVRDIRNIYLKRSDQFYPPDRWELFTDEMKEEMNLYRKTLRDLPQDFEDSNSAWDAIPEPPSWAAYIIQSE